MDGEFLCAGGDQFLRAARRGEGRTQVGVGIEDDPLRPDLARDVDDIRGRGVRDPSEIRLVAFLRTDEAHEGLFDPTMPFRLRDVGDAFERLLPHLVLEVIHMEEQAPHRRTLIVRMSKAPATPYHIYA